jgi:hypothetical protein
LIFSFSLIFSDGDESNIIDFSVHINFHSHFFNRFAFALAASTAQNRILICVLSEYIENMNWQTIALHKGEREWKTLY